nr:unnamed protein product [Callosobruchus analis]
MLLVILLVLLSRAYIGVLRVTHVR